jgi:hypothetical protein
MQERGRTGEKRVSTTEAAGHPREVKERHDVVASTSLKTTPIQIRNAKRK